MNSRTKKILIGAGIVVGGLAILVVALILSFVVWISRPTPLADSVRLLSPETTGYVELTLEESNSGTVRFLERLQVASGQRGGQAGEEANVITRQNLAGALPMVATWSMTPSGNGSDRDLHVGMVSAPRFGRWLSLADGFMGLVGGGRGYTVTEYAGERIFDFDTRDFRGAVFVIEGTIFATTNVQAAEKAIDLFRTEESGDATNTGAALLGPLIARTDSSAPLRGAIANENGEMVRLWETVNRGTLGNRLQLDNVDGVFLDGALDPSGGLEARATIVAPGTEWTDAQVSAISNSLGTMIGNSLGENDVTVVQDGSDLIIGVRIPNLAEGIAHLGTR
jgi:hypothetical protein